MEASQLEERRDKIKRTLEERLETHDESRKAAQEKLHNFCEGLREQINTLEERVNKNLEEEYTKEDDKLQTLLNDLNSSDGDDSSQTMEKAKAELLVEQTYEIIEFDPYKTHNPFSGFLKYFQKLGQLIEGVNNHQALQPMQPQNPFQEEEEKFELASLCKLKIERKIVSLKPIDFEERKPEDFTASFTEKGELSLSFSFFSKEDTDVLKTVDSQFKVEVKIWKKDNEEDTSTIHKKDLTIGSEEPVCLKNIFTANTTYCFKMRIVHLEQSTQWSDTVELTTEFEGCCSWVRCPIHTNKENKYFVDEENPRVAIKMFDNTLFGGYCTAIGNNPLPLNKITSWYVKVLRSKGNDGSCIYIGVAPSGIDQKVDHIFEKCGWYFNCWDSKLYSGPPHNYKDKEYGPRKELGGYVHTGDSVGVMMDTAKGELSFVVNGVNLGVAYEEIPLDEPLVPCALLGCKGDSVELVF